MLLKLQFLITAVLLAMYSCQTPEEEIPKKLVGQWQQVGLTNRIWEWSLIGDSILQLSPTQDNGVLDTLCFLQLYLHPLRVQFKNNGIHPDVLTPIFEEDDSLVFSSENEDPSIIYMSISETTFNLIIEQKNGKIHEQDHYHFTK